MPLPDAESAAILQAIFHRFADRWKAETDRQMHNVLLYGTTHPEIHLPGDYLDKGYLSDSSKWYIKGSFYDLAAEYAKPNDAAWRSQFECNPWDTTRYQKEKIVKEGPFKSTVYGDIPMSLRGRELLMKLRDAVAEVASVSAKRHHPTTDTQFECGHTLSTARGDLAKYISELEAVDRDRGLPVRASIYPDASTSSLGRPFTLCPFWLRVDYEHGRPSKTRHSYEEARRERDVILAQIRARRLRPSFPLAPYQRAMIDRLWPTPAPAPKPVSLEQIAPPLQELCLKNYSEAVRILKGFNVERASQVPGDKLPELLLQIKKALDPFYVAPKPMPKTATEAVDHALDALKYSLEMNFLQPKNLRGLRFDGVILDDPFNTKETKMTDKNQEAGPAVEAPRSVQLAKATQELIDAQRALENITSAEGEPEYVAVRTQSHAYMANAIAELVKEQWVALSKKAVTRAKARVAKAEKALSVLVTG